MFIYDEFPDGFDDFIKRIEVSFSSSWQDNFESLKHEIQNQQHERYVKYEGHIASLWPIGIVVPLNWIE